MFTFRIYTFGCKANKYDSALLSNILAAQKDDFRLAAKDEHCDLLLVNTCTVTDSSDAQARQLLRKIKRENPDSKIFALGCYAKLDPSGVGSSGVLDGNLAGGPDNEGIVTNLRNFLGLKPKDLSQSKIFINKFPGHTRAFLKIQDGCNSFCSYCIIPYARGTPRSMPKEDVLEQMKIYHESGYQEVVLTGIHLGIYGKDLSPKSSLLELLCILEERSSVRRIRLSSIEPEEISSDIIRLISQSSSINKHFHIPLQSGDDQILQKMQRKYSSNFFERKLEEIKNADNNFGIGTDLISGFPGETESHFTNTLNLIKILPLSYIHVFPYSRREGTKAASFSDQLDPKTIRIRAERLREIGREKRISFRNSMISSRQEVLVESKNDKETGFERGFTRNYVPVCIQDAKGNANRIVDIIIERVEGEKVFGKIYEQTDKKIS
jgi:threonylcarbamoyladenosine tRNA methylthiotransferase MtaB